MLKNYWMILGTILPIILFGCYYPMHNPDNIPPPAVETPQGTFTPPAVEKNPPPLVIDEAPFNIPERGKEKMSSDFWLVPYLPHTYLAVYDSNQHNWQGKADILAPIYFGGNNNLYLYGQWRLVANDDFQNTWTATAGLGYRQVLGSRIYGVYLLTDYSSLPVGSDKYWVISPGIESLGKWVDFRANGYFPQKKTFTSDSLSNRVATGNEILADQYEATEETGNGADAEVGVKLFSVAHMPFKVFVNGYYFNVQDHDAITGIGGRITFQPTRYLTLEVKDSYDNNQHNVFLGGIKVYFNGMVYGFTNNHVDDQAIQSRLFDPIERSFAMLNSGTSTPVFSNAPAFIGQVTVENHDIFVEQGGSGSLTGSGTAEDPYIYNSSDLQTILDAANSQFTDYSHVIFAPGNYYINSSIGGTAQLYGSQTMRGTENDFVTPAASGEVTFFGGLVLGFPTQTGQSYNLENFTLLNDLDQPQGVTIQNGSTAFLSNLIVGVNSDNANNYQTGIVLDNSSISLANTIVYGFNKASGGNAIGLNVINGGNVTATNGSIIAGFAEGNNGLGIGLYVSGSNATIGNINSDGSAEFGGSSTNTSGGGYGLYANGTAVTIGDINNVSFLGTTNGFDAEATGNITIQNIRNSFFAGNNMAFYAISNATLILGLIDSNIFQARNLDMRLTGSVVQVNSVTYSATSTDAQNLFNTLSNTANGNNNFNLTTNAVCIGSSCVP